MQLSNIYKSGARLGGGFGLYPRGVSFGSYLRRVSWVGFVVVVAAVLRSGFCIASSCTDG